VAGALDAALVVAARRATAMRARAREVEIVVVSPVVEEEWTLAVPAVVRDAGVPVRWARLAPAVGDAVAEGPADAAPAPTISTPTVAALLNALGRVPVGTRVIARTYGASDSAFAAAGGAVVAFAEPQDDTVIRAVLAGDAGAIGPWGRAPSGRGTPVAWWEDGTVAATQEPVGQGCFRTVGIRLPVRGDDILRPSMAAVMRRLAEACTSSRLAPVPATRLAVTPARTVPDTPPTEDPVQRRWWLACAAILLVAEWGMRRRRERMAP
jgi:hypothetical protein